MDELFSLDKKEILNGRVSFFGGEEFLENSIFNKTIISAFSYD